MSYKLTFELVPESCWCSNLRSALPPQQWAHIRKKVQTRAQGKCEICGTPAARIEAHEVWEYDDKTHVQRLGAVVGLCPLCHAVKHIGYTQLKGDARAAEEHFMRVNQCTYAEFRKALGEANALHRERSRYEWQLDSGVLNDYLK